MNAKYISLTSLLFCVLPLSTSALSFAPDTVFLDAGTEAKCLAQGGSYTQWYGETYCTQDGQGSVTIIPEVVTEPDVDEPAVDLAQQEAAQVATAAGLALQYLTVTEAKDAAKEAGVRFRIVEQDGEPMAVTMDYRPGRINAAVEGNVVVSYTIEGSDITVVRDVVDSAVVPTPTVPSIPTEPVDVVVTPPSSTTTPADTAATTTTNETTNEATAPAEVKTWRGRLFDWLMFWR